MTLDLRSKLSVPPPIGRRLPPSPPGWSQYYANGDVFVLTDEQWRERARWIHRFGETWSASVRDKWRAAHSAAEAWERKHELGGAL